MKKILFFLSILSMCACIDVCAQRNEFKWETTAKYSTPNSVATWNSLGHPVVIPISSVGAVSSVFSRTGAVTASSSDYSSFYPLLSGSYGDPSFISTLSFLKLISKPTTLSGYGITDGVINTRTLTINGTSFDLSANRSWTVGDLSSTRTLTINGTSFDLSANRTWNIGDVFTTRTLTINGTAFDLSANRSWTVGDLSSTRTLTINGTSFDLSANRTWNVGDVFTTRTLTINGTAFDLSANRSWSVGTLTGTMASTLVPFGVNANTLTTSANLFFNDIDKRLDITTSGTIGVAGFQASSLSTSARSQLLPGSVLIDSDGSSTTTSFTETAINPTGAFSINSTGSGDITLGSGTHTGNITFRNSNGIALSIEPDKSWNVNGSNGSSGQVLTSNGPSVSPTWQTPATVPTALSGTYTPTITNGTNVFSTTAYTCQYMQVGTVVTVSGKFAATGTTGGVQSFFTMTLPVATTFSAQEQCGGTFTDVGAPAVGGAGGIYANASASTVTFTWKPTLSQSDSYSFHFTYFLGTP